MDKTILAEYADVQQEIKDLRRRIRKLEDEIAILENSEVSDSVSCGKKGKKPIRTVKVSGTPVPKIARKKMALASRKTLLEEKEQELLKQQSAVEEFIQSIEKSELRTLMRLYYLDGLVWYQVALRMNEIYPNKKIKYTEDGCRKRHNRFIEKNKKIFKMSANVRSQCDNMIKRKSLNETEIYSDNSVLL